jgi:hypothetical protein
MFAVEGRMEALLKDLAKALQKRFMFAKALRRAPRRLQGRRGGLQNGRWGQGVFDIVEGLLSLLGALGRL